MSHAKNASAELSFESDWEVLENWEGKMCSCPCDQVFWDWRLATSAASTRLRT